jgi:hypothetical protein
MNYRRYQIFITSRHHQPLPDGLLSELGCSISEPSNWIEQGNTGERGLTFLDTMGRELDSEVFVHLPIFVKQADKTTEKKEIEALVFNRVLEVFHLVPDEVHVHVRDY